LEDLEKRMEMEKEKGNENEEEIKIEKIDFDEFQNEIEK
jgi:hypothetical protein